MELSIDETDRRILRALQRDAGLSADALAEAVGMSRNACWRRVKQLEASGVIARRVALVDPEAVGMGLSVFVLLRTSQHDADWLTKFERAVRSMPEIVSAHRMAGDIDYILRVRIGSMKEYDNFYQRLITRVPVSEISASFVMDDIKDTTELPV
ncbi:Lrp/AsnC family transcriptional regulator [Meridianimarinicoccus aquatilis]|uniref:Lrp/AsnC family transcriptional regulator n=1 Tax=Meridianimarinicoccus aquatilis TaxID=2552766 RepID=A0A4R6AUL6_9RHOB|nr:Lrp/AsnC family transcriptional regulator [Fluviibacterium aquatile]TDL87890.1 Lrp/AsnC family transcriptional regulator [Fluviibacterium aquatile]